MAEEQQKIYDEMSAHQSRHHQGLGFTAASADDATPVSTPVPAPAQLAASDAEAAPAAADAAPAPVSAPAPAPTPAAAASPLDDASPAARAAAIAARISAQLAASGATSGFAAPAPAAAEDPAEKARAIAAHLSTLAAGTKRRFDALEPPSGSYAWSNGSEARARSKVPVPSTIDLTWATNAFSPMGIARRQIESDTGARVYLGGRGAPMEAGAPAPDADDELHVLVVAESDEQLDRTVRAVRNAFHNRESNMTYGGGGGGGGGGGMGMPPSFGGSETLYLPNSLVGYVIGRGGENIRDIQTRTGAHVQIQREQEMPAGSTERLVTITGPPAGVVSAKQAILLMVETRKNELTRGGSGANDAPLGGGGGGMGGGGLSVMGLPQAITLRIPIPDERVGYVIGKAGANIRGIEQRNGVRVQIPQVVDADNPRVRTMTITGATHEATDAAQRDVMNLLATDTLAVASAPGATTISFQIPNERAGYVIGRQGVNIRELQQRSGTRIQINTEPDPGSAPPTRTIRIMGNSAAAERVRDEIMCMVHTPGSGLDAVRRPDPPFVPGGGGGSGGGGGAGGAYGGGGGGGYGGGHMAAPQQQAAYGGGGGMYGGGGGGGGGDAWAAYYGSMGGGGGGGGGGAPAAAAAAGGGMDPAAVQAAWAQYYQQYYAYANAMSGGGGGGGGGGAPGGAPHAEAEGAPPGA